MLILWRWDPYPYTCTWSTFCAPIIYVNELLWKDNFSPPAMNHSTISLYWLHLRTPVTKLPPSLYIEYLIVKTYGCKFEVIWNVVSEQIELHFALVMANVSWVLHFIITHKGIRTGGIMALFHHIKGQRLFLSPERNSSMERLRANARNSKQIWSSMRVLGNRII